MSKKKSTAKANFAKTPRQDALVVGAKLSQALWPHCKIVTLVGSIRQGKDMIGDIDIVVIPSIEPAEFLERCKDIIEYEYGGKKKIFGMFMNRPINIFVTDESGYGVHKSKLIFTLITARGEILFINGAIIPTSS